MITGVFYIVALQFCSGSNQLIRDAYKLSLVLTAQHAGVAQTSVGVAYYRCTKCVKHKHVLYIFTTDTFEHYQKPQHLHVIVW